MIEPCLIWEGLYHQGNNKKCHIFFLRDVAFQLSELQRFIRGLQQPCCSLNLERTRLLNGTWAEALDSLRKTAIRSVSLSDPLGAECDDIPTVWRAIEYIQQTGHFCMEQSGIVHSTGDTSQSFAKRDDLTYGIL